jgi:hypothetical protein
MNRAEESNLFQAELRKFRGSTFERKQMSTTIKRIALVAVAAMGLGVVSSVPSNAAPSFAFTTIGDSTAGQALIGGQAVVVLTPDTNTSTIVSVSGVGTVVAVSADDASPEIVRIGTSLVQWTESSTVNSNAAVTAAGKRSITVYSAVEGVTTITARPLASDGSPGTAVTRTITWVTALAKNSTASSLEYIKTQSASITDSTIEVADSTTAQLSYPATLAVGSGDAKAVIWVKQFSSSDTTTVSTLAAGKGNAVKVEISGAGSLGLTDGGATGSVVSMLGSATTLNEADRFFVYADGRSGTATITITVGTKVTTKTVKFTGTAASYKVSADADEGLSKLQIGVGETATFGVDSFDSLNNRVAELVTLTASNETASVATIAAIGTPHAGLYTITGVKEGAARFKLTDGTASRDLFVGITVTKKTAATIAVAFDKTSYAPGEKVTWTITAKDSTGKNIADGARALFGSVEANLAVTNGTLFGTSPSFVDGVATGSFFAPAAASGRFEITVSQGAADDVRIAALAAATTAGTAAPTAVKTTYGFDIVNAGNDAALDAANEAATAAQDATDAAIQAADAADEATAAVAALSLEMNTLMAGIKKQLATLYTIVIKLKNTIAKM